MNKLLSLALWLWLPIALDAITKCINCQYERPGKRCVQHKKPCKLHIGESCFKKTIYYGKTPIYIEKGCLPNCVPLYLSKESWNISAIIRCCADKHFCNR